MVRLPFPPCEIGNRRGSLKSIEKHKNVCAVRLTLYLNDFFQSIIKS